MDIVHLETGRHLYGGAQQVLYLMEGLRDRRIDNTLVCPPGSDIALAAADRQFRVIPMPMAGDLDVSFPFRLAGLLGQIRPDLLHVHSRRGADSFGGLAARMAGVPAVLSRRVDSPETPVIGRIKYLAYQRVIAISAAVRAQLVAARVPQNRIRLIHSGVDSAACSTRWTRQRFLEEFGLPPGSLVVATVAQMIPRKGHRFLLDEWPRILASCPNARLVLFGTGRSESQLRAQAASLSQNTVTFAGFRPDLLRFMGHIDLLVHPAMREGLGVSLLQAQAAGVPVAAFRAGGIPEIIVDWITGVLLTPGNSSELGDTVIRLLLNHEQRRAYGAAAREQIAGKFSIDRMVEGNLAVYRELPSINRQQP